MGWVSDVVSGVLGCVVPSVHDSRSPAWTDLHQHADFVQWVWSLRVMVGWAVVVSGRGSVSVVAPTPAKRVPHAIGA